MRLQRDAGGAGSGRWGDGEMGRWGVTGGHGERLAMRGERAGGWNLLDAQTLFWKKPDMGNWAKRKCKEIGHEAEHRVEEAGNRDMGGAE
jgi:hypothetical protein